MKQNPESIRLPQVVCTVRDAPRISSSRSKRARRFLIFTPHPDDDTFCCGGTLALLQKGGNKIHIFIYTNDDKGSLDLNMTSEGLARIRKKEEEDACKILGIPAENIHWLQFHDGMLEYANPMDLVEEVTKVIRTYKPDVVMSIDPGSEYVRWHKTDHRMAANNTHRCDSRSRVASVFSESAFARWPDAVESPGGGLFLRGAERSQLLGEYRHRDRSQNERRRRARQPVRAVDQQVSPRLGSRRILRN